MNITVLAGEYIVDREADNLVTFISKATWEEFEGTTQYIDGYVYWEGDDLAHKSELYFEVELNTVRTGNGKRDRDMRDDYLHTNKYPFTHFTGKIVSVHDSSDTIKKITSKGQMYIHGVERKITVSALMIKNNSGFQIKSDFKINLKDYKIKIPQLMILKINEEIHLKLSFFVKSVKPGQ